MPVHNKIHLTTVALEYCAYV